MTYTIEHLSDLPRTAQLFLEDFGHTKIFAFDGEMGVGKTTFISALLTAMGIKELEGSPTYSIVNVYESAMFGKINHFDMYRLKNDY
jgi:tRNA threonylcarbamoyladenosine biosynthesis protein TsaE